MTLQRFGAAADDRRTSVYYGVADDDMGALSRACGLPRSFRFHDDAAAVTRVREWVHADMGTAWSSAFHGCVNAFDCVSLRPLLQHPKQPVFREDGELPLICIGDALHVLPPYTGAGGNLAMQDAADVADYIVKGIAAADSGGGISPGGPRLSVGGLRELELRLMKRAAPEAEQGERTKKIILGLRDIEDPADITLQTLTGGSRIAQGMLNMITGVYNWEVRRGIRT